MSRMKDTLSLVGLLAGLGAAAASAHMTPPVTLHGEREIVAAATKGAAKLAVREVRLSEAERAEVARRSGWRPPEGVQRFFIGRDDDGKLRAAVTFLTEFTIHGPVRVGVALGPDEKVLDVEVVELTEETYAAFKPVLDHGFTRALIGASGRPALPAAAAGLDPQSLGRFYGEVVTDLVARGIALIDVAILAGDAE